MPKDWTEITVDVQRAGKKKTAHIDLMAMIKEGKTVLQIGDVTHWPSEFASGDRVVTSFSVSNKGTIVARDVTVFFYLNGKQKNKVTVTIPAGDVADVQMPWIAMKGKNKVRIRLKEP
jgi:subtilase family serine protease